MKYLIWDFDGTLGYRDGGMWSGTLLEIVSAYLPELNITIEQLRGRLQIAYPWHTPERTHPELCDADAWWLSLHPVLIRAMSGAGVPAARAEEFIWEFRPRYTDLTRWRLFSDTLPVLKQLSAAGWRHVLLTNHVPELPVIVEHLGLMSHMAAIFNSAQTGYEKPHPQAFRNVLDFIGEAEAVWMIGDNPKADVAGAEVMGIPAILVRTAQPGVRYCCEELSGVGEIIEEYDVTNA